MDSPAQGRLPSTFRALRHRNYRLFFFGQIVSLVGVWMQIIALQWLVYDLTGSAAMLALVNLLAVLPVGPLSLWGGSLADRVSKRSILVVTQLAMMILALCLAALTWTGTVEVWHVLLLAMATASADAIALPTRQAFVVELVGSQDLSNAIGLNSMVFNAARAVGPAIAGVAVATTGVASAFLINGLAFSAVIVCLLMMRLPARPRPFDQPGLGSHLSEAIRYVGRQRVLVVLISLVAVSAFLALPYMVLLPMFAETVLNQSAQPLIERVCAGSIALFDCQSPDALTYGLLVAASGLGSVIGALVVASLPTSARRGRWLTAGSILFPALLVCMALSRSFILTLALLAGIGFSFVLLGALANTLIQLNVPDALRGRVMSFYTIAVGGMMRLGGLQAGLMGDAFGAAVAVGVGALVCLAYGLFVAWRFPRVRQLQ